MKYLFLRFMTLKVPAMGSWPASVSIETLSGLFVQTLTSPTFGMLPALQTAQQVAILPLAMLARQ